MNISRKKLQPAVIPHIAETLKALGNLHRLRIFEALSAGEKSVCQLGQELDIPQAIVSQQLKIMKTGQVVIPRRAGSMVFYRIANPGLLKLLSCLLSCQDHCLETMSPNSSKVTSKKGASHE